MGSVSQLWHSPKSQKRVTGPIRQEAGETPMAARVREAEQPGRRGRPALEATHTHSSAAVVLFPMPRTLPSYPQCSHPFWLQLMGRKSLKVK